MMSRVHKNNFHDVLSHCQITVVGPFDLQHPVSKRPDTHPGLPAYASETSDLTKQKWVSPVLCDLNESAENISIKMAKIFLISILLKKNLLIKTFDQIYFENVALRIFRISYVEDFKISNTRFSYEWDKLNQF